MPRAGFEPAQALAHCPLKTACLPVPPPRQKNYSSVGASPGKAAGASAGEPKSAGAAASN